MRAMRSVGRRESGCRRERERERAGPEWVQGRESRAGRERSWHMQERERLALCGERESRPREREAGERERAADEREREQARDGGHGAGKRRQAREDGEPEMAGESRPEVEVGSAGKNGMGEGLGPWAGERESWARGERRWARRGRDGGRERQSRHG